MLNSQQQDAQGVLDQALWEFQHQAVQTDVTNGDFPDAPPDGAAPLPDVANAPPGSPAAKVRAALAKSNAAALPGRPRSLPGNQLARAPAKVAPKLGVRPQTAQTQKVVAALVSAAAKKKKGG